MTPQMAAILKRWTTIMLLPHRAGTAGARSAIATALQVMRLVANPAEAPAAAMVAVRIAPAPAIFRLCVHCLPVAMAAFSAVRAAQALRLCAALQSGLVATAA
jgi:hypothetical protein